MIKLEQVEKVYSSKEDVYAIKSMNLTFNDRGLVFVVGPNGSGKSTLLHLIASLEPPTSGHIYVNQVCIDTLKQRDKESYRRSVISHMVSESNLISELSVEKNILLAYDIQGLSSKETRQSRIEDTLKKLELTSLRHRLINTLSKGQQRRVVIACALIKDFHILLCDEPTENLDEAFDEIIYHALVETAKTKLVIVASHDHISVDQYANRVISIHDGNVVDDIFVNDALYDSVESQQTVCMKPSSPFRLIKYLRLFTKHQTLAYVFLIGLLVTTMTVLGTFFALSHYDAHNALLHTLEKNHTFILPVSEYSHHASFIGPDLYGYGVYPIKRSSLDDQIAEIQRLTHQELPVVRSYYFQKNIQDFLEYHVSIGPGYVQSAYQATLFNEVKIVPDFSTFHAPLLYGTYPIDPEDVLIYDFMADKLIQSNRVNNMRLQDLIDYVLIDHDTGFSMRIMGIIKTDFEKYAYTANYSYTDFPKETSYLQEFQSIFAKEEFLVSLTQESSVISINEIVFKTSQNGEYQQNNTFRKVHIKSSLSTYSDYRLVQPLASGFMLSKHQYADLMNVDPNVLDIASLTFENISNLVRFMYVDNTWDKPTRNTWTIPIIGIYESDSLEPYVLDFISYTMETPFVKNGEDRHLYLLLSDNPNTNNNALRQLKRPYLSAMFFLDNPTYQAYGYSEFSHVTDELLEVERMIISISNFGSNSLPVAFLLLLIIFAYFTQNYYKKNKAKTAILSIHGASLLDVTFMYTTLLFLVVSVSFVLAWFPINAILGSLNHDISNQMVFTLHVFSLRKFDYFIMYFGMLILVIIGTCIMYLLHKIWSPIALLKQRQ